MSSRYGILIFAVLLVGCQAKTPQIKEVFVPVYKYVAVPEQYTAPLDIAEPEATKECGPLDTVCELRQVAHKRKLSLQQCNKQLGQIRFIQGSNTDGN